MRDVAVVEVRPTSEGRTITMIVAPQPNKAPAKPRSERPQVAASEQPGDSSEA
jgi:hypothetical protein